MKQNKGTINVYRAVLDGEAQVNRLLRTDDVMRPPLKVPYVVDNLWEWMRPEQYPSRRFAAFASPQPDVAREQGAENAEVYRVEFSGDYRICQVKGHRNAKNHPDCISLPIFLFDELGQKWLSSDLESKDPIGRLWIPTLSKVEVESLLHEAGKLRALRDALCTSIRFWEDVELVSEGTEMDPEGELFFEAPDGYYLRLLTQN